LVSVAQCSRQGFAADGLWVRRWPRVSSSVRGVMRQHETLRNMPESGLRLQLDHHPALRVRLDQQD
jgi:hypothetical protein